MPEHIDNLTFLSSGGHTWAWGEAPIAAQILTTVGTSGAARSVLGRSARPGAICGRDGGPACLRANGADRAAADLALTTIEGIILGFRDSGAEVAWEDDAGRAGEHLVIDSYQRVGPRRYGRHADGSWTAWQFYGIRVLDLSGGVD